MKSDDKSREHSHYPEIPQSSRRDFVKTTLAAASGMALLATQSACNSHAADGATAGGAVVSSLDAKRAALLVMHYQTDILNLFPAVASGLVSNTASLIAQARALGISIVFVRVAFSAGYPEVSPRNKNGTGLAQTGLFVSDDIHPGLGRTADDRLIISRRVSAFYGTELDLFLRARGIETLLLVGIASSGVVLSTIAYASDADYRLFTIKDCCYDPDETAHERLCATAFGTRSTVIHSAEIESYFR